MTPLFPSAFEETTFWVVFLAGILVAAFIEDRGARRSRKSRKKVADKGTYFVANLALFLSLLIAILLGYARIGSLPGWFFYPGLAAYLFGIAFASWAIFTLGRCYAPTVQVQSDHRIIDTGAYRFIRHPIYAGGIISYFGIGLALQSWAAILVLLVALGLGYANRIRVEEKFLVAELGDDYVEYCKRTKRFIPFIF